MKINKIACIVITASLLLPSARAMATSTSDQIKQVEQEQQSTKEQLGQAQNTIEDLKDSKQAIQKSLNNLNEQLDEKSEEMDNIENDLKAESQTLCLLTVGSTIVSPESIKKNIISKVVASINTMINSYLSELCVNFTCCLSSDMNDYEIQSAGGELDFPNLSLGEQMKLIISSQLAFRKFLMSRFGIGMNVMIIDEVVDRALDSVSIQKLLGILLQLSQKETTNISIISHRGEVEEMFKGMPDTQMMVVQKSNNISKIVRSGVDSSESDLL